MERNKDSIVQKKSRSKNIWFWSHLTIILNLIITIIINNSSINNTEEVLQVLHKWLLRTLWLGKSYSELAQLNRKEMIPTYLSLVSIT